MSDTISKQYLIDQIKNKLENDKWVDMNGSVSALEFVISLIESEDDSDPGDLYSRVGMDESGEFV